MKPRESDAADLKQNRNDVRKNFFCTIQEIPNWKLIKEAIKLDLI